MANTREANKNPPAAGFAFSKSLEQYASSMQQVLSTVFKDEYKYLATSVLVFRHDRLLLVQRAENDSMPGCWETPGGACDDTDETVLHGAARELMEEAGQSAVSFVRQVGEPRSFRTRSGKVVVTVRFLAEVREGDKVRLDPKEHQNFAWVTRDEVHIGRSGSLELRFAYPEYKEGLLKAFDECGARTLQAH